MKRAGTETSRWAPLAFALACAGCGDDGGDASADTESATGTAGGTFGSPMPASTSGQSPADSTTAGIPDPTVADTTGPASTGADTTTAADPTTDSDGSTGTPARCPATHECFYLDGVFHVADEKEPTFIHSLPVEAPEFSAIEVELDVVHGGWFADDPSGLHNIFWLHRGQFGNFTWAGGVAGYVNTRGPGSNIVRTRHDLDVADVADSQNFNINGVALTEGTAYHVYYRYDTTAQVVTVEVSDGDTVVAEGTDVPTTDRVRNNDNGFFIWFANPTDVDAPGPEVPSLGWSFSDLRVEFIP